MHEKQYQIFYKDGKPMIYVGIDIAKETHVAAAVDSDGVIIIEPFSFTNNHEDFKHLKSKIDSSNCLLMQVLTLLLISQANSTPSVQECLSVAQKCFVMLS